jgi:hypothetical protein
VILKGLQGETTNQFHLLAILDAVPLSSLILQVQITAIAIITVVFDFSDGQGTWVVCHVLGPYEYDFFPTNDLGNNETEKHSGVVHDQFSLIISLFKELKAI